MNLYLFLKRKIIRIIFYLTLILGASYLSSGLLISSFLEHYNFLVTPILHTPAVVEVYAKEIIVSGPGKTCIGLLFPANAISESTLKSVLFVIPMSAFYKYQCPPKIK